MEVQESEVDVDALQSDLQEVLGTCGSDPVLARFRIEHEKLHRAFTSAYANEQRLKNKCSALKAEVVANSAKVKTALTLAQDDQEAISQLKSLIEETSSALEQHRAEEEQAKTVIQQLNQDIKELERRLEEGGLGEGTASAQDLLSKKETLERDVRHGYDTVARLRSERDKERERFQRANAEKQNLEHEVELLNENIRMKNSDYEMSTAEKSKLDQDLAHCHAKLQHCKDEVATRVKQLEDATHTVETLKHDLAKTRAASEGGMKELAEMRHSQRQLASEIADCAEKLRVAQKADEDDEKNAQALDAELVRIEGEIVRRREATAHLQSGLRELQKEREALESQRQAIKEELVATKFAIEQSEKNMRDIQRAIDQFARNEKALATVQDKDRREVDGQKNLEAALNMEKSNLEGHVNQYKDEAQKQRKVIHNLEGERDRLRRLAVELTTKLKQAEEEVKIKELVVLDKKKKLQEVRADKRMKEMQYEAVRSDRNLYAKQFQEAQDEIAEYKRKFNRLNHQIDQLKEEIGAKEQAIFQEHLTHTIVQKQFSNKQGQLAVLENQIMEARKYQQSQEEEITKLKHIINEADTERMRQTKALDAARNERDILGAQLIRRNEELARLYETINIQKFTLAKGESQYSSRMKDIQDIRASAKRGQREVDLLISKAKHVEALRKVVDQLQRELLKERSRVKVLSEELENPMNIHRWRKLEGTDPHKYELIRKIQMLQKRLIAKTEEVAEKDLLIQQKEKYFLELKSVLARQPGPEVSERLALCQANLKTKTAELRKMNGELKHYQSQVNEFKYENDRLIRQLHELKDKYVGARKREFRRERRQARMGGHAELPPLSEPPPMPATAYFGEGLGDTVKAEWAHGSGSGTGGGGDQQGTPTRSPTKAVEFADTSKPHTGGSGGGEVAGSGEVALPAEAGAS